MRHYELTVVLDPTLGEVTLEVERPGVAIGKGGSNLLEVVQKTHWTPNVVRSPPIPSLTIKQIRGYLYSKSKEREKFLRETGESIFRPMFDQCRDVRVTFLGSSKHVGRSAILIRTVESSVLLDCGINPGTNRPLQAFPRIDVEEFDLSRLDAVVITHAHLDHCGFLPYLYKYGYKGPVYCSAPTASLMTLLQGDYLDVMTKEGRVPPYGADDIREVIVSTIPLAWGEVTDVSPDIRLTLHNAGHILGSSIVHLHVGEGLHNLVYTGDFKYGKTTLLEAAATEFPRVETIITESTYGAQQDMMPTRIAAEERLSSIINETLEARGKVIIPVPAVGRAQEIMLIIDGYMKRGLVKEAPVFIEGMISEATAIHTAYPEYLAREVRNSILHEGINPFQSDYFTLVEHPSARDEIVQGEPCIIMATAGMLEGGPVIDYFKRLASDERNAVIFVSYQIEGTLGRRVQKGLAETPILNNEGRIEVINVKLRVESIEGFSGHSDRRQIVNFIRRVTPHPEKVLVCHGEKAKCLSISGFLRRKFKIDAVAPDTLETVRLR